jgi:hypothetical protein
MSLTKALTRLRIRGHVGLQPFRSHDHPRCLNQKGLTFRVWIEKGEARTAHFRFEAAAPLLSTRAPRPRIDWGGPDAEG